MLKIDFSKAFQPTIKKSASAVNKRGRKKAVQLLHLGDERRLVNLPETVTVEFLSAYKENLDDFLYPYVTSGYITLSRAHDYEDSLITTIFGDEKHLGIFEFLQDKNVEGKPEKQLVTMAEQLILKGWRIQYEDNKYWLLNSDFGRVIDLTGKAGLSKDAASMVFDPSNAHLFLDDDIASKVQVLASKQGYNADDLAGMGHLDLLLAHTNNLEFSGYLINYNNLRKLLHKVNKYHTSTEGVTMKDLHEDGFRLHSQITFPIGKRTILERDGHEVMLTAVSAKLNPKYIVNETLLSVIASKLKVKLFKRLRFVQPEKLTEIKELRQTFAIMRDFWSSDTSYMTYSDMVDALHRLDVGYRERTISEGFYKRAKEAFSAIVITETILLGNNKFSLASIGFDSISGKFFSYASNDNFTVDIEDIKKLDEVSAPKQDNEFFSYFTSFDLNSTRFIEHLPLLWKNLPKSYLSAMQEVTVDDSDYDIEFAAIRDYFEIARTLILEKGK